MGAPALRCRAWPPHRPRLSVSRQRCELSATARRRPLHRRHEGGSVRRRVRGSVPLLPGEQGGGAGLGLPRPVPGDAGMLRRERRLCVSPSWIPGHHQPHSQLPHAQPEGTRHCMAAAACRGGGLKGLPARLTGAGCWLADYEEKEEEREAAKKKALADGDKEGDSNSWASGSADGEPSGTWK